MGRELRRVPANWKHPQDSYGKYIPMYNESYAAALAEWLKNNDLWSKREHPEQDSDYKYYAEYGGDAPCVSSYLPYDPKDAELCTHFQGYETTTEGTPITPVFSTIDECAEFAAEHATTFAEFKADKAKWMAIFGAGDIEMHRMGNIIFI